VSTERPRPEPSELTEEFWARARDHVLVRPRCNGCGTSFFTPQIACPSCLSEDWEYVPSSGRGTVYSATVVHRAPFPGLATPYQVAVVDLEEDWSMLTNIVEAPVSPTPIGTQVEVAWIDVDAELTLPAFRPVGGATA
jgi:uncharacterized OB-fold protein